MSYTFTKQHIFNLDFVAEENFDKIIESIIEEKYNRDHKNFIGGTSQVDGITLDEYKSLFNFVQCPSIMMMNLEPINPTNFSHKQIKTLKTTKSIVFSMSSLHLDTIYVF